MNTSAIGVKILASLLLLAASFQLGSAQFLDLECGLRSSPDPFPKRILIGNNVRVNSSPWMAFIVTTHDYFVCSGTLITNRLILTAAQCYHKHRHLKVVLGEYDKTCYYKVDGCNSREELNVDLGIMHPNFNLKPLDNDIAILRLARRVEYRENIKPICIVLDKSWRNYIDGIDTLTAFGWGHTRPNGTASIVLQSLSIRRRAPEICTQYVNKDPLHNKFCAENFDGGICKGDTGGPIGKLIRYENSIRFIQVGIASLTNPQCNFASIFTDVLSHVDWILSVKERYGLGDSQPRRVQSPTRRNRTRYDPR